MTAYSSVLSPADIEGLVPFTRGAFYFDVILRRLTGPRCSIQMADTDQMMGKHAFIIFVDDIASLGAEELRKVAIAFVNPDLVTDCACPIGFDEVGEAKLL